jgi:hypothetical protein
MKFKHRRSAVTHSACSLFWFVHLCVCRRLYCYMLFDIRKREQLDKTRNRAIWCLALFCLMWLINHGNFVIRDCCVCVLFQTWKWTNGSTTRRPKWVEFPRHTHTLSFTVAHPEWSVSRFSSVFRSKWCNAIFLCYKRLRKQICHLISH